MVRGPLLKICRDYRFNLHFHERSSGFHISQWDPWACLLSRALCSARISHVSSVWQLSAAQSVTSGPSRELWAVSCGGGRCRPRVTSEEPDGQYWPQRLMYSICPAPFYMTVLWRPCLPRPLITSLAPRHDWAEWLLSEITNVSMNLWELYHRCSMILSIQMN